MRRRALWFAILLALAGCKSASKDRTPAEPASRTKPTPKNWLEGPTPDLDRVGVPPADSWADPRDPGFDVDREVRGVLAGFVEDPGGRKVRDVYIQVEPATGAGSGSPVGVMTDRQGYFQIKGLQPKSTYLLSVQTTLDGRKVGGQVYARTTGERSQFVRLSLIEGLTLPNRGSGLAGASDLPGPAPGSNPTSTSPLPPPVLPSGDRPAGTGLPLPSSGTADEPPPRASRPDLVAPGPDALGRPPAASIPSPTASRTRRGGELVLVDTLGVPREFPSGRIGELVLLDFMTTTCLPCKKAIPTLKSLQARYGLRGVEVVGVVCDSAAVAERRALASRYQRDQQLNYLLFTEPGNEPGTVARRFGVTGFPTLVLLDESGKVLWTGHPSDVAELERIIDGELSRRPR
jgi:thiol-disulfide isomerase/thioredoxin